MSVPSIKGTIFRFVAEDAAKGLANGDISEDAARRYLEESDFALIQRRILPVEWIDVRAYARVITLLRDWLGNGHDHYLIRRGERAAEALLDQAVYGSLELLRNPRFRRVDGAEARFKAYGEDLRTLSKLSATLTNFSHQTVELDPDQPDRYRFAIRDAADYPEVLATANLGFMNRLFEEMGDSHLFRWARVAEDEIHYTMVRPPKLD